MAKRRQPPKLLSRVIRAVAGLKASKGCTAGNIADQVRKQLTVAGPMPRNVALQIRKALKYAVDIGALTVRYGLYKMAFRRKIIPVDSLDLAMDCRFRRNQKARAKNRADKAKRQRRRGPEHDARKNTKKRHAQDKRNKKHASDDKEMKDLLVKKEEPSPKKTPSSTETEQQLPSSHRLPTPHDKVRQLDKRRRNKIGTDRNQTSYPEYNDSMRGDDKESLTKISGKPRRPRPPILPIGSETVPRSRSVDSQIDEDNNEVRGEPASSKPSQQRHRAQDHITVDANLEKYLKKYL